MAIAPKAAKILAVVVILSSAAWATAWVHAQGQSQPLGPSAGGSLAELTAEVRQLRLSIEGAGRTQVQVSAMGMALTAQQGRLVQVTSLLEKVDDELREASRKTELAMGEVTDAQARAARPGPGDDRAGLQRQVEYFKEQAAPFLAEENRLRQRQQELTASYRNEEARWLDLVAKLEEIIKR